MGSIPGWGTKIPHAKRHGQRKSTTLKKTFDALSGKLMGKKRRHKIIVCMLQCCKNVPLKKDNNAYIRVWEPSSKGRLSLFL